MAAPIPAPVPAPAAPRRPSPTYLAGADAAGLLRHHTGLPYVAGHFTDPATGEDQFYVEYCATELLAADVSLTWLVDVVRAEHSGAGLIVVRSPGGLELPPPWSRHQTYVWHAGESPASRPPNSVAKPGLEVITADEANSAHTAVLTGWLEQAMVRSADERGLPCETTAVRDLVRDVLATPGRTSYLALHHGRPIGHLTLCPERRDEVTGEPNIELCDLLVEVPELRKDAAAALTAAALELAATTGVPLLGQVQHPDEDLAPGRGERVLAGLLATGWAVDHILWRLTP